MNIFLPQIYILSLLLLLASCAGNDTKKVTTPTEETIVELPAEEEPNLVTISDTLPESELPAEDPEFVVSKDTVSANGPRSITRNVLLDKNGNIWLATWQGVMRYDGKTFTNVTLQQGLRQFHVFSLLEDKAGNLWFGTIGGGVYCYNPVTGKRNYFTTADGLISNTVMCMLQDKEGFIWFGTDKGVSCYDTYSNSIISNFDMRSGLSSDFISCIAEDQTGKLWFGTNGGVCRYDREASPFTDDKRFKHFPNEKDDAFYMVRAIVEDQNRNIWIASADGLCCYDYPADAFTYITAKSTLSVFEDKAGKIWFSSGVENSSDMTLFQYENPAGITQIKTDKQIFGIAADRDGNTWYGTANGVCRYDGEHFTYF
jgi:ligand-binding sensor domain-containing protein